MTKLLLIILILFTLTSYSQKEYDDVYYTVYDTFPGISSPTSNDTIKEYITNNYYINYTARINRFYKRPFYTSYWSYHNPYWYSYYYPYYTDFYWWWYSPYWSYYGWYSPYKYYYWYSYYPTHHYVNNHHDNCHNQGHHLRTSNTDKKTVNNKPIKVVNKNTVPKYQTPKPVKYIHISHKPVKTIKFHPTISYKPTPNRPKVSQPNRATVPSRNIKMNPSKIQHIRKKSNNK